MRFYCIIIIFLNNLFSYPGYVARFSLVRGCVVVVVLDAGYVTDERLQQVKDRLKKMLLFVNVTT